MCNELSSQTSPFWSTSAPTMNYTALDHTQQFFGEGGIWVFLLCTMCSSKHCMIYQSLETAWAAAAGFCGGRRGGNSSHGGVCVCVRRLLANAGWQRLCLHGWGHTYEPGGWGEVTSAGRDGVWEEHACGLIHLPRRPRSSSPSPSLSPSPFASFSPPIEV